MTIMNNSSYYNGQSNSDEKLTTTTSPNLVSNFIIGCESVSKLSSKTSMMSESSETLGSLQPITVSGRDLGFASNLYFASERSILKKSKRFFEDGGKTFC